MPVMDGIAALRAIRGAPRFAQLPVVMVTGRADAAFVNTAIGLGVSGFLLKPFTLKTLDDRVQAALAVARTANAQCSPSAGDDKDVLEI